MCVTPDVRSLVPSLVQDPLDELVVPILVLFISLQMDAHLLFQLRRRLPRLWSGTKGGPRLQVVILLLFVPITEHEDDSMAMQLV